MSKFVNQHRTLLGYSIVAAAVIALVTAGAAMAGKGTSKPELPGPDNVQECPHDDEATFLVEGLGTFEVVLGGSVVARTGEAYFDGGLKTIPIDILGTASRDYIDGIGEVTVTLDRSRPVKGSQIQERAVGTEFPASQHMRFHILVELEARPGIVYRSIQPIHMVSDNVTAFPPADGTSYRLVQPIDLEDVDQPGIVAARLLKGAPTIFGAKAG
ncbi:MAG: hypothetical protein AAF481_12095 [Acidobacteriota bacterium]